MTRSHLAGAVGLVASLTVLAGTLGACTGGDSERTAGSPAYCATQAGADDADFWQLIEQSCRVATDGDVKQARALREVLDGLDAEQVADFHRTFVRVNHSLHTERTAAVADDVCLPDLGLGNDLFTDYRNWVIAHGQDAYASVLASPETLADFPDVASGCGKGEPFGYAAFRVYAEKAGRRAAKLDLPRLEPTSAPEA